LDEEPIMPSVLNRWLPPREFLPVQIPNRHVPPSPTVGDVCRSCAGGPLADLDGHAETFLADVDCGRTYSSTEQLTFTYDYDLLLRWLLRISYNGARHAEAVHPLLRAALPFVLSGQARPPLAFLAVEVLRDHLIDPELREELVADGYRSEWIPARMFRTSRALLSLDEREHVPRWCGRAVCVNAWLFTLCLVPPDLSRTVRRGLSRSFLGGLPRSVQLRPSDSTASVVVSSRTCVEAYAAQGRVELAAWRQYVEQTGYAEA
jgi:hypothetical protein